jgi:nucleotide sugar dehydrogenase
MIYRDVNIALANELAEFSERVGIDFSRVCEVSNRDGEAGLLTPGIGVGGHCTPVYPYFLTQASQQMGLIQRLATTARDINDQQPRRHLLRLAQAWGPLEKRRVHIMGLGFRPEVKVDTLSPAYALLNELRKQNAIATLEDPYYSIEEIRRAGFTPARVGEDFIEAVVLNTAHADFANPDFWRWRATGVEAVVDGRNLWDAEAARRAGILFLGVGKAPGKPAREDLRQMEFPTQYAGA